jgi:hypothetical protein
MQATTPRKSSFGALLMGAAKIGNALGESIARKQGGGGPRQPGEPTCTPCAAQARKEAAVARRKDL